MVKKRVRRTWRKADIEDVEEALEDDRLVDKLKRQGGGEKKSKAADGAADEFGELDGLFTVDTQGSCEGLSRNSRRAIARAKLFPPKGPKLGLSAAEEEKIERAKMKLGVKRKLPPGSEEGPFDLWAPAPPEDPEEKASTVRRPGKWDKGPGVNTSVKVPKTLHEHVGTAPAVLPAHGGQSVNPSGESYEDLVCAAAAAELEREQELENFERRMRPITHELREKLGEEKVNQMSEEEKLNLFRSLHGMALVDDEAAPASARRRAGGKEKSQAHKNKTRQRKAADAVELQRRAQRKLEKSIGELGALQKALKEDDALHEQRRSYRAALKAERTMRERKAGVVPKGRRIGGTVFSEAAVEVAEADVGAKGLRAMKLGVRTSVVKDRLASIVRRGMLPAQPEMSKMDVNRAKKWVARKRNKRKFVSPLLRDNLLLR